MSDKPQKSTEQIYFELGLGIAARVCETMAAAIEAAAKDGYEANEKHPFSKDSIGALRATAGIIRGQEEHWAARKLEADLTPTGREILDER